MKNDKHNLKWYDNAKTITSLIIVTILLIFICSQSIAVGVNNSFKIFSSVINHNTSYLLILIYFISIRTKFGKRYFNYFNLFLIFIYFILSVTSFLTIIQSFSFNTIIEFILNIVILIYLFHTMFRDTRIWKEYKLGDSPFNEVPNDYFFSTILILITISLIINLVSTVVLSGLIISILDAIYIGLLSRYIFLYREYLDQNKLDINNKGNFDSIKNEVSQNIDEFKKDLDDFKDNIKEKADDIIEKYDLDEKIDNTKDKLVEASSVIKEKTEEVIDKYNIDEKFDSAKDKVIETSTKIKEKTEEVIGKTDLNKKKSNIKKNNSVNNKKEKVEKKKNTSKNKVVTKTKKKGDK